MANEPTDTLAGWHEHVDVLADLVAGTEREWSWETWRALKDAYALATEKERVPDDKGIIELIAGLPPGALRAQFRCAAGKGLGGDQHLGGFERLVHRNRHRRPRRGSDHDDLPRLRLLHLPGAEIRAAAHGAFQFNEDARDVVASISTAMAPIAPCSCSPTRSAPKAAADHRIGWHYHLDRLPSYLAGAPDPRSKNHHGMVESQYEFRVS
ncbi:MAG: hypothetical protein R2845_04865 [Thermomicrobiales bacterium]